MTDEPTDAGCEEAIKAIREAVAKDDGQACTQLILEAMRAFPESAEILGMGVGTLAWQDRREEAHEALQTLEKVGPDTAHYWTARADLAAFEGRTDEAAEAARRALALEDRDWRLVLKCIGVLSLAGDHTAAMDHAARLRGLWPDSPLVWCSGITTLDLAGRSEEALELLSQAERQFPDSPLVLHKRARVLWRSHRLDEASGLLHAALAVLPGNSGLWAELAQVLSFAKSNEEAEAAAMRSLEICPCSITAMHAMVRVCRQRGQARQANDWARKAASAIPAMRAVSALAQANAAIRRKRWKKALSIIDEALPGMVPHTRSVALGIKARALLNHGNLKQAEEIVSELTQGGWDRPDIWELSAMAREKRGDAAEAIRLLREGIGRYRDSGTMRARLIRLLCAQAEEQQVAAVVVDAFANQPQTPWEYAELAMALSDTGQLSDSREMRRIGLERFPGAEELTLLAAVDQLELGDAGAAKRLAMGIKGELRGVALAVRVGAVLVRAIRWLGGALRGSRNGD